MPRSPLAHQWALDPDIAFLNHGSFGACPTRVLAAQSELRSRMEREPVRFLGRELEPLLDGARASLATFVGAAPSDLVFVPNATYGVNAVLRSLSLAPGDELVTTQHEYNASKNALQFVAEKSGAKVVLCDLPFPGLTAERVVSEVLSKISPQTRLLLIDHVSSQTGLVFPVERLVAELSERGIDTLIDGAHGPGMVPLELRKLGAAYYTGNCHKWLCAPKSVAFLHVRPDRQPPIRPLAISHGANSSRRDRSRFQLEFDWTGTHDPTPYLCVPEALSTMSSLVRGGWPEVMRSNKEKVIAGRKLLCASLGIDEPAPESMLGSMASIPLPDAARPSPPEPAVDPLQEALWTQDRIEVPIVPWPRPGKRLLRISAQLYNSIEEYERLAAALPRRLAQGL